jgi:hypothetical protein
MTPISVAKLPYMIEGIDLCISSLCILKLSSVVTIGDMRIQ